MEIPEIKPVALTTKQFAKRYGISESLLRQGRMNGDRDGRIPLPPFIKIGRKVLYLQADIDAWLNSFPKLQHLAQPPKRQD